MLAALTPHETARLRQLALARAAQLRGEALQDLWSAAARWASKLRPRRLPGSGGRLLRLG